MKNRSYDAPPGRINPELKAQWVEALRSGKYTQGQLMLRTPDNDFCCLGVLCDITNVPWYRAEIKVSDGMGSHMIRDGYVYGTKGSDSDSYQLIPANYAPKLRGDIGRFNPNVFSGNNGVFSVVGQTSRGDLGHMEVYNLPSLNDGGFTFDQIADIINYFL